MGKMSAENVSFFLISAENVFDGKLDQLMSLEKAGQLKHFSTENTSSKNCFGASAKTNRPKHKENMKMQRNHSASKQIENK